ncbi:MAG: 50S ribosomal protein L10 [Candidatus Micrarchaeales archaeon]|nr:50S ribosomal protein L10 [Candidatus Micrarchaeales archaeon]
MKFTKDQKMKFVQEQAGEVKKYSVVGVLPLNAIPDRLVQKARNSMRSQTRFIIAKKSLLIRILESDEKTKPLVGELGGMSAILLSNEDPFVLYQNFKSSSIKLAAKPGQVAPEDINIEAQETTLQPGQTVTELKQAGIDVQIQKGKVVIAKDKVLVKKGTVISVAVAKALKTLDIMPFTAAITPKVLLQGKLVFTTDVLSITPTVVSGEMSVAFRSALALSIEAGIVNQYTIVTLIERAFRSALAVGIEGKVPEPGIVEKLVANAALQASALGSMVKEEPAEASAKAPAPAS